MHHDVDRPHEQVGEGRDHFGEFPASWVVGVSDRGRHRPANEDALALAADRDPGGRAVLVVCDGVASSTDSAVASLAGARAARDRLVTLVLPTGTGAGSPTATDDARVDRLRIALQAATEAADSAVVAHSVPGAHPASATLVAAVLDGPLLAVGSLGDSRAYWVPDVGEALLLSVDDSVVQARIEAGAGRAEAEAGPHAHAITRWLGRDAPDVTASVSTVWLDSPGWVLLCSDGLWNYAPGPAILARLVADARRTDASELALALVGWANEQGGRDNVTVALARFAGEAGADPDRGPLCRR